MEIATRRRALPKLIGASVLARALGLSVGALSWATMTRDFVSLSEYYWQEALHGSGGANVVNVILVDFRGFDTFGEIMVLGISALIIFALLDGMLRGPARAKLAAWSSGQRYSPNRHPLVMVVVTRLMLPLSLMVSAFIFLRGHNLPGGGFIAAGPGYPGHPLGDVREEGHDAVAAAGLRSESEGEEPNRYVVVHPAD
jgi:multisubunit Na+/H+ antiporter MnhB subunit